METVEVVIKIPKEEYEKCKREEETIRAYQRHGFGGVPKYIYAILNGTVLPKGHGRLKDVDVLIDTLGCSDRDIYCKSVIEEDAPTIIEADREVEG